MIAVKVAVGTRKYRGNDKIPGQVMDENVHISGMGTIEGALTCWDMNISGSVKANAPLFIKGKLCNSGMFRAYNNVIIEEDLKSSGTTNFEGKLAVHGQLHSSGIFNCTGDAEVAQGARITGVTRFYSQLISNGIVESTGITTVHGHLIANQIQIMAGRNFPNSTNFITRLFRSTVDGTICAGDLVQIRSVNAMGNVIGREVKILSNVTVKGAIYFVDKLEIDEKAEISDAPIQISLSQLDAMRKNLLSQNSEPIFTPKEAQHKIKAPNPVTPIDSHFCPSCGFHSEGLPNFCPACGTKLNDK